MTFFEGIKETKEILEKHSSDHDLSIYLSLLLDEKKTYSINSKEAIMTVFSQIFLKYGKILGNETFEMQKNSAKIRDFLLKQFEVLIVSGKGFFIVFFLGKYK